MTALACGASFIIGMALYALATRWWARRGYRQWKRAIKDHGSYP
jgi:hypothetical protein